MPPQQDHPDPSTHSVVAKRSVHEWNPVPDSAPELVELVRHPSQSNEHKSEDVMPMEEPKQVDKPQRDLELLLLQLHESKNYVLTNPSSVLKISLVLETRGIVTSGSYGNSSN